MSVPIVGQERSVRIVVLIATHEMVPATFAGDLSMMLMYTSNVMPEGAELGLKFRIGTYVHQARQHLILGALAEGATHILWLDSDMRFPKESIAILFQHLAKGHDMVGINYVKREIPTEYVAFKSVDFTPEGKSVRLVTNEDATGLEEVDALGFGMVMMKASALKDMPSPKIKPWFWFEWLEHGAQVGEDVHFCRMFKEQGKRIYVDHDLSKLCAHTGSFEYKLDHADIQV